jgi:cell wall-associated NlpC family hydrolase
MAFFRNWHANGVTPMDDARLTPSRPDLAAYPLREAHPATRYGHAQTCRVVAPSLPLRRVPDGAAPFETELLYGEDVSVYDLKDGFAWVQAKRDGYVGYIPAAGISAGAATPTHRVAALRSFVYAAPTIKGTPLMALPFNALVRVEGQDGRFAKTEAGFLHADHLSPLGHPASDRVAEAERFIGIPYLWGGKSSFGLDCSGLVESACFACGIPCLRDSDLQEKTLGTQKTIPAEGAAYARGDLLFWPGHVAIAQGNGLMIHANAHHMMVVSEPIDAAIARIAAGGTILRSVRHLPKPA